MEETSTGDAWCACFHMPVDTSMFTNTFPMVGRMLLIIARHSNTIHFCKNIRLTESIEALDASVLGEERPGVVRVFPIEKKISLGRERDVQIRCLANDQLQYIDGCENLRHLCRLSAFNEGLQFSDIRR